MEDFGYSKEQEENYASRLIRRTFLIGATLFSIACFIYITISAYYFFSQDADNAQTIHAQSGPIKVIENNPLTTENESSIQIDSSIYEDIFGTRKPHKKETKVIKITEAPLPPKEKEAEKISQSTTENTTPEKIIVYSENKIDKTQSLLKENGRKKQRAIKVQIAALTSKISANKYFNGLQKDYPSMFKDLKPYVQEVDLGKRGIFYRVQIGDFFDQIKAEAFCKRYITHTHKSKADCIVVE